MSANWPEAVEYHEAVQSPRLNFQDADLREASAVTDALGLPQVYSGSFASVYQLRSADGARSWAVKCFTRRVPGQRERYREISRHLDRAALRQTVGFQYLEEGIRIRGEWYPILKMDWITGLTLRQFVEENLDKPKLLGVLLQVWLNLEPKLCQAQIAHGDLQHGNVLLIPSQTRDGRDAVALRLIDYDGLWVPALAGQPPGEVGLASYQHPQRSRRNLYTPDIDRFPHQVVATALKCLSRPEGSVLWKAYDNGENLLFTKPDFEAPAESGLIRQLWNAGDRDLRAWVGRLVLAAQSPLAATPRLDQLVTDGRLAPLSMHDESSVQAILNGAAPAPATRPPTAPPKTAAVPEVPEWATLPELPKPVRAQRSKPKVPEAEDYDDEYEDYDDEYEDYDDAVDNRSSRHRRNSSRRASKTSDDRPRIGGWGGPWHWVSLALLFTTAIISLVSQSPSFFYFFSAFLGLAHLVSGIWTMSSARYRLTRRTQDLETVSLERIAFVGLLSGLAWALFQTFRSTVFGRGPFYFVNFFTVLWQSVSWPLPVLRFLGMIFWMYGTVVGYQSLRRHSPRAKKLEWQSQWATLRFGWWSLNVAAICLLLSMVSPFFISTNRGGGLRPGEGGGGGGGFGGGGGGGSFRRFSGGSEMVRDAADSKASSNVPQTGLTKATSAANPSEAKSSSSATVSVPSISPSLPKPMVDAKAATPPDLAPPPKKVKLVRRFAPLSPNPVMANPFAANPVVAVLLTPDGKHALAATSTVFADGQVFVFDTSKAEPIGQLGGSKWNRMDRLVVSPDGKRVCCVTGLQTGVWDLERRQVLLQPKLDGPPRAMAFSPDGQLVYFAFTGSMQTWDTRTGTMVKDWTPKTGQPRNRAISKSIRSDAITVSPDGTQLLSTDGKSLIYWNALSGQQLKVVSLPVSDRGYDTARLTWVGGRGVFYNVLAFTSGASGLDIISFDNPSQAANVPFRPLSNEESLAISANGKRVAVAEMGDSRSNKVVIWDADKNQLIDQFEVDTSLATSVALSADGKFLLTCGDHKVLQLWELPEVDGGGQVGGQPAAGPRPPGGVKNANPPRVAPLNPGF